MSSSVPMPLAPELQQAFSSGGHRAIFVEIVNETLKLGATLPKGASESADFEKLKGMVTASDPCYILFRLSSPAGWLIITYIPETVKVNEKMVYAATKSRLKNELGNDKFVDEMHANEPGDFVWSNYAGDKAAPLPYSNREMAVNALNKMESDARKEFVSAGQVNTHSNVKSSGYHTVTLPFTDSATAALQELKQSSVNFVELKVTGEKTSIEAVGTRMIDLSELATVLPEAEPRFCFYRWDSAPSAGYAARGPTSGGTVTPTAPASVSSLTAKFSGGEGGHGQTGGYRASPGFVTPGGLRPTTTSVTAAALSTSNNSKIFFIYYCPEKSSPQLRMVYSTSKPSVAASAEPIIGAIRRKVEVGDRSELNEEYLRAATAASPAASPATSPYQPKRPGTGGSLPLSSDKHKPAQGHPVYTMGAPTVNAGGKSKRIVIPPPVAYNG